MFDEKKYNKQWCKDNPEKVKHISRRYRENNRDKIRERDRLYYKNNPEKMKEKRKKYCETHEYNSEYFKIWRENNPEYDRQYRKNNLGKIKMRLNQWQKNRRRIDLKYNLTRKMSCMVNICLKKNKNYKSWKSLVDYTLIELIKHLKKTMPKGYKWQDFLKGRLHIDHIIPISAFNFIKPENPDFNRCWALKNLQLLTAEENRIKHNKLLNPFQPALKLKFKVVG